MSLPHLFSGIDRPNRRWFVISAGMVLVIATLVLSLTAVVKSSHATKSALVASQQALKANKQALATANCVNEILALRQSVASTDSAASLDIFDRIGAIIALPTGSDEQAAFADFLTHYNADLKTLGDDQAFRTAHPLGQC